MQQHEFDHKLLCDISTQISMDGGASLVRDLKDYLPRIEHALKKASITKLLAFLEKHPHVFSVDRQSDPHFVHLISDEYVNREDIQRGSDERLRKALEERIVYMMKKQLGKEERRNKSMSPSGVRQDWLLKQCKMTFHYYLRESGFYFVLYSHGSQDVKIVGSNDWMDLVMDEFMEMVKHVALVQGNRIFLPENIHSITDTLHVSQQVVDAVQKDGGTHISLSLLLHRYPELKPILAGQDVILLKEKHDSIFHDIEVFKENNEVYFHNKSQREGRMLVDETGLFSVASSKWGNAFASIMANASNSVLSSAVSATLAIDLTASVGGITLSLSRKFHEVLAMEIDEHRAHLCNQNMKHHNCNNVTVRCTDSIASIPTIAMEYVDRKKVFVVDPPWGGYLYKHKKDNQIMMGPWTMIDVVNLISKHMSPTIIGFRMPTDYDSKGFVRDITNCVTKCDVVEVRKVGPQLFIILSV